MPEAFLFDIGNVIISFDFQKAADRIEPHCDMGAGDAFTAVTALAPELELGKITPEEFIAAASDRIGYRGTPTQFRESFEDIFELNEPVVDLIEQLGESGMPLYLLSNTNGIHVPFFEKTYPVFSRFRGRIYSHEVGCMKPDPGIYRIAEERLGLTPSKTVYIDDVEENCEAGREAGWLTVHYTPNDHDDFLSRLSAHWGG